MDRRFSNATSSLASASLRLRTELVNYGGRAGRSGESLLPRAALYARPWPEVAPGPGPPARYAIRARKDGKRVKFYSRPGNDLTWRFSRSSLKRCPDSGRAPASLTWAGELRARAGRFRGSGCRAQFAAVRDRL